MFSRKGFLDAYLTVDARSLALGRIVLATVLLIDLLRRVPVLRDLYSNDGVLPNHTVLWRPPWPQLLSVFFSASHVAEAAALFVVAGVCFLCLLVGWKTRLFHVLSFVMATSLHNRILFVENSGSVALGLVLVWTAFLPLGRRFSVDALSSARDGRGSEPRVVSLAVLGLLVQLSVIYAFNFFHKSGVTWREGTAVHYMLFQERIVTHLGVWVREQLPFAFTKALTHGTLFVEAAAPCLILCPVFRRWTRLIAFALLVGLHGGIALLANLGIFSAAMFTFLPFLV
ncbi:MAG TPA: HTTM domain-containing protein, partial [Polyangia bacterium]|nr:HTTM domain-containing protein [Polyangia bacterium]